MSHRCHAELLACRRCGAENGMRNCGMIWLLKWTRWPRHFCGMPELGPRSKHLPQLRHGRCGMALHPLVANQTHPKCYLVQQLWLLGKACVSRHHMSTTQYIFLCFFCVFLPIRLRGHGWCTVALDLALRSPKTWARWLYSTSMTARTQLLDSQRREVDDSDSRVARTNQSELWAVSHARARDQAARAAEIATEVELRKDHRPQDPDPRASSSSQGSNRGRPEQSWGMGLPGHRRVAVGAYIWNMCVKYMQYSDKKLTTCNIETFIAT
jgi:hypothetical protein